DAFTFTPGAVAGTVVVMLNATTLGTFAPTTIAAYGGAGTDTVVVNGTKEINLFTLDANKVMFNGIAHVGASIETRTINAKGAADTITAYGSAATVNGGGGRDTLIAAMPGNSIWNITARNAGNLNGVIFFTSVQNLTGGDGADLFHLADGVGVSGQI